MTRVLLIQAGPTAWDAEERISGNLTLPLTYDARQQIAQLIENLYCAPQFQIFRSPQQHLRHRRVSWN